MQHQIYPDRFNDDGEFVPAVIVEVPNILYLQVVDEGDCEDWPAPSEPDERTHCDERINSSDVAYVPAERAERAEAEAAHYRAQLSAAEEAALECQREAAQLRAELDAARGIETAEQPPEVGQRVQIIITADFVHGGFEPVADNRLFLPRHMAPFWRPLWAGTQRGYEVHVMTGSTSTSAGRRQRDAGKE